MKEVQKVTFKNIIALKTRILSIFLRIISSGTDFYIFFLRFTDKMVLIHTVHGPEHGLSPRITILAATHTQKQKTTSLSFASRSALGAWPMICASFDLPNVEGI